MHDCQEMHGDRVNSNVPYEKNEAAILHVALIMPSYIDFSLLLTAITGLWFTFRRLFYTAHKLPHPPGPPLKFAVGNLLDMPTSYWWLTFAEWSKQYGDIVHIDVLGQHLVILQSVEDVKELLERRATNFSDRPYLPMVMDL